MIFGGEGLFLATPRRYGTVYLQSSPFSRLVNRIISHASSIGSRSKGEGSVLDGIVRMIGGDWGFKNHFTPPIFPFFGR